MVKWDRIPKNPYCVGTITIQTFHSVLLRLLDTNFFLMYPRKEIQHKNQHCWVPVPFLSHITRHTVSSLLRTDRINYEIRFRGWDECLSLRGRSEREGYWFVAMILEGIGLDVDLVLEIWCCKFLYLFGVGAYVVVGCQSRAYYVLMAYKYNGRFAISFQKPCYSPDQVRKRHENSNSDRVERAWVWLIRWFFLDSWVRS